jgi:hypothetical protein
VLCAYLPNDPSEQHDQDDRRESVACRFSVTSERDVRGA